MITFEEIKRTLKKGSGKCVVLQEEQPQYVVMTWGEYEKLENAISELRQGVDIGPRTNSGFMRRRTMEELSTIGMGVDINEIPIIE